MRHWKYRVGRCLILAQLAMIAPVLGAAPITSNTAVPVGKGEFVFREQFLLRQREDADNPLDRDIRIRGAISVLGYGINPDLAVFGVLPWLDKEMDVTTPVGRRQRQTSGIGDLTVFARYTLYKENGPGWTRRLAPIVGIKAPTGEDNDRDALGRLPRRFQLGSGSWDGFVGLVYTWQTQAWQIDAQARYRKNGSHDGYTAGDAVNLDASWQYRLWPRQLGSGVPGFLYGVLETNLSHTERDRIATGINNNSGGTRWFITPGLQYVTRRWVVEAAVQLPAAQNLHGQTIEDEFILVGGFRVNF